MKRLLISLALSIFIHIATFASLAAIQMFYPVKPPKHDKKVLYVKQIKKADLPKSKPAAPIPRTIHQIAAKPKVAKNTVQNKKSVSKPNLPKPSPTPEVKIVYTPVNKKEEKKKTKQEIQIEKENKIKLAVLKKNDYFKNWSDERIKALPLPPGMKSWEEVEKMNMYLDNNYQWVFTPPNLGNDKNPSSSPQASTEPNANNTAVPVPTPTATPSHYLEWKAYFDEEKKIDQIRFYNEKTGYIASFNEKEMKIEVQYFPFDGDKFKELDPTLEIEVKPPEDFDKDLIKTFTMPLTKEDFEKKKNPDSDRINKDSIVMAIVNQKNLIEGK